MDGYPSIPSLPVPHFLALSVLSRLDHRIAFSDRQKEFSSPYFANERQQCNYLEGELQFTF